MGKKISRHKVKRRNKSISCWIAGRIKSGLDEPTQEEIELFKTGYNMGWKERTDENKGFWRGK